MSIEIKVPDLGDGVDSGDILEILVREGDTIRKDQGIVELETDKATVEVPCRHAGRVAKVLTLFLYTTLFRSDRKSVV